MSGKKIQGQINELRIVCFGIGNVPVRARAVEESLIGTSGSVDAIEAALDQLNDEFSPVGDLTTSAESKLHLAGVLLRRTLASLFSEGRCA
jgi:carbon-monoxide dehydrogenase medium subunit